MAASQLQRQTTFVVDHLWVTTADLLGICGSEAVVDAHVAECLKLGSEHWTVDIDTGDIEYILLRKTFSDNSIVYGPYE